MYLCSAPNSLYKTKIIKKFMHTYVTRTRACRAAKPPGSFRLRLCGGKGLLAPSIIFKIPTFENSFLTF